MNDFRLKGKYVSGIAMLFVLLIVKIIFIDVSVYASNFESDYWVYKSEYELLKHESFLNNISSGRWEPGFALLMASFSLLNLDFAILCYFLVALLGFGVYSLAYSMNIGLKYVALSCIAFLVSPICDALTFVATRQGYAISMLVFALIYYSTGRAKIASIYSVVAVALHYSSIIFLLPIALIRLMDGFKKSAIFVYLVVLVLYVMNIPVAWSGALLSYINLESGYLQNSFVYEIGFKSKFLAMTIILTIPLVFNILFCNNNRIYRFVSYYTLVLTVVYIVFSGMPYYDRFATVSWFFGLVLFPYFLNQFSFRKM